MPDEEVQKLLRNDFGIKFRGGERVGREFSFRHSPKFRTNAGTEQDPWVPAVNVYEQESEFVIQADLPGVRPDEVEIKIERNVLSIRGVRRTWLTAGMESFHTLECTHGHFFRALTLPPEADAETIKVEFAEGVLSIVIGKRAGSEYLPVDVLEEVPEMVHSEAEGADPNYQAYLSEAAELEQRLPGGVVAYAEGRRIAEGADARELASRIPERYRGQSLLIKHVSSQPIKFRRPYRVGGRP